MGNITPKQLPPVLQEERPKDLKPTAIIFDMDGTLCLVPQLAKINWDNEAYCKDLMFSHEPNWAILSMMNHFYNTSQFQIIIATARPSRYSGITRDWLTKHKAKYDVLLTRPESHLELSDADVKVNMAKSIHEQYGIWFWVEDRTSVVTALRANGVTVLQCAKGDY